MIRLARIGVCLTFRRDSGRFSGVSLRDWRGRALLAVTVLVGAGEAAGRKSLGSCVVLGLYSCTNQLVTQHQIK